MAQSSRSGLTPFAVLQLVLSLSMTCLGLLNTEPRCSPLTNWELRVRDGWWLTASSCHLVEIPTYLPDSLKHLDLSNNSITVVRAADLSSLPNLRYLILNDNRIETIEDGALADISVIKVNRNQLRMLPNPIPANVSMFQADSNQIQQVFPSNFAQDSNMEHLYLRNNSIENLEANTFSRLIGLRLLLLDHNKIQVMHKLTYSGLHNLRVLSLGSNPVREVETGALRGLPGLVHLELSEIKGEVTGITGDTFRDVPSLKGLDLHGSPNLVTLILNNTDVLRGLSSLQELNLMDTNLTHLDVDFLSWLPNLQHVALKDNPWQCDDKLLPLRHALWNDPYIFESDTKIICNYPEYLSGIPVISLEIDQFTPMTTLSTATTVTTTTSTTPSSPTQASASPTNENTDGESTTNHTTSLPLPSAVTTERSTSTSASPSKTLLSSTTARSRTTSTTASSSTQVSASPAKGERESATNRSWKDDHTKAMVIGVSVSLMVLAIVAIAILIFVCYRRHHRRVPMNQNGHPSCSFKQEYSTSSDTVLICTHANGPETNPGSPTSTAYKDTSDGDKHSGSQEAGRPGNPKNQNDAKHKNKQSGMNYYRLND